MKKRKVLLGLTVLYTLIALNQFTYGIICLNDSVPPDLPNEEVVGRWPSNASFVVVGKDWIVTTRHQGGLPTTITIGGNVYNCEHRTEWNGGPSGTADIRLIRLTNPDGSRPDLAYTEPYSTQDEINKDIVIGGFGQGKGNQLITSSGLFYGYSWNSEPNTTRRWCTNYVMSSSISYTSYTSDSLTAFFDAPESPYFTEYEGTAAMYDSGGGWFIKTPQGWKVAALNQTVSSHTNPESWFKSKFGSIDQPDWVRAVRISTYAEWIKGIIRANTLGDVNGDSQINNSDISIFAARWCSGETLEDDPSDVDGSGCIDVCDLISIAENWLF